jgi:hypothetical protein
MKQIIIEISDQMYNYIKDSGHIPPYANIAPEIANGTVLPKGHGELIDKDVVLDMMNHGILEEYITTMGGVIHADR